jgi:hypothetical protein
MSLNPVSPYKHALEYYSKGEIRFGPSYHGVLYHGKDLGRVFTDFEQWSNDGRYAVFHELQMREGATEPSPSARPFVIDFHLGAFYHPDEFYPGLLRSLQFEGREVTFSIRIYKEYQKGPFMPLIKEEEDHAYDINLDEIREEDWQKISTFIS